jgi:hypothetical protein
VGTFKNHGKGEKLNNNNSKCHTYNAPTYILYMPLNTNVEFEQLLLGGNKLLFFSLVVININVYKRPKILWLPALLPSWEIGTYVLLDSFIHCKFFKVPQLCMENLTS